MSDLQRQVAEKLGWHDLHQQTHGTLMGTPPNEVGQGYDPRFVPDWPNDIAAAQRDVWPRLGESWNLFYYRSSGKMKYDMSAFDRKSKRNICVTGKTPAEASCRALVE
jgi:hypothetical protein